MKWAWSVARSTCGNLHGTVWLSNAGNTIFTTSLPQNKRTKASKYAVERTSGTPVNNEMGVERRSTCGDLHGTAVVEQLKQYSELTVFPIQRLCHKTQENESIK